MPSPKPARIPAVDAARNAELARYADELGSLESELLPLKPKIARVEQIRKAIRCLYSDSDPGGCYEALGTRYTLQVGPRAQNGTVNIAALLKAIGSKLFAKIATVTQKAIEENCPAGTAARVVEYGATGPRTVKTFERPAK